MLSRLKIATQTLQTLEKRTQSHKQTAVSDHKIKQITFGMPSIDSLLDGGLIQNALHEVRCSHARDIGTAIGFVIGLLALLKERDDQHIIWVCDPATSLEAGKKFPLGLQQLGLSACRITMVKPSDLMTAMWAADEASKCSDLAAVIFQVKGNPARFDMTATRRLQMRSKESGVLSLILRQSGQEEATAAMTRWHVGVSPSQTEHQFKRSIGQMRQSLTLERNRNGQIGKWLVAWNPRKRVFEDAAIPQSTTYPMHRLYPLTNRSDSPSKMGQVMAG